MKIDFTFDKCIFIIQTVFRDLILYEKQLLEEKNKEKRKELAKKVWLCKEIHRTINLGCKDEEV